MYMMYPDLSSLQSHLNSTNFTFNFVKINQEKRALSNGEMPKRALWINVLCGKKYILTQNRLDESTGQTIQKFIIKIDFGINQQLMQHFKLKFCNFKKVKNLFKSAMATPTHFLKSISSNNF